MLKRSGDPTKSITAKILPLSGERQADRNEIRLGDSKTRTLKENIFLLEADKAVELSTKNSWRAHRDNADKAGYQKTSKTKSGADSITISVPL